MEGTGASEQVTPETPVASRGRSPGRSRLWSGIREGWPVWVVAGTTFLTGALSLLQMVVARLEGSVSLLNYVLPLGLHHWGRSLTLVIGFVLIYVSFNLFQRKRVAWYLATIVSAVLVVSHLLSGLAVWYLAAAPALSLGLLVVSRRLFTVRSEPTSIRRGLGRVMISLLIALVYGTAGFLVMDTRDAGAHSGLAEAAVRALRQVFLVGNSDLAPDTALARWFLESLSIVGVLAWAFAAYSLFRPVAFRLQVLPGERALAQAVLSRHGRSPYDFFKVWPDKAYFFSDSRRSFMAYATFRGVALVLGDPSGPEDELPGLTGSFLRHCSDNGWTVCFLFPDLLPMYRRLGLSVLKIGEEAVVDLERFSSVTGRNRYFRYHQNHFHREGYRFLRYKPPHPDSLLDEVEQVSREWLTLPKRRELGFVQGRFDRGYVASTPLDVVRDRSGQVIAFLNEVPTCHAGEATFDMMRQRPGLPNGIMDFLFQQTMLALRQEGCLSFNMGVAPFSGLGDRPDASMGEKALGMLFRLNWFVSSQGLRNYKLKFGPVWKDRFVAYTGGPLALVGFGLAISRALEGQKGPGPTPGDAQTPR